MWSSLWNTNLKTNFVVSLLRCRMKVNFTFKLTCFYSKTFLLQTAKLFVKALYRFFSLVVSPPWTNLSATDRGNCRKRKFCRCKRRNDPVTKTQIPRSIMEVADVILEANIEIQNSFSISIPNVPLNARKMHNLRVPTHGLVTVRAPDFYREISEY